MTAPDIASLIRATLAFAAFVPRFSSRQPAKRKPPPDREIGDGLGMRRAPGATVAGSREEKVRTPAAAGA
jgi:hypothetical protein